MKLFIVRDIGGIFLYDERPVWCEETQEFYPQTPYTSYELTRMFVQNSLKIGECKEIEIDI